MIESLPDRIAGLPSSIRRACDQIFHVSTALGCADPPPTMDAWVARHFGTAAAVRQQTIVRVVNRLTLEGALFNPLRARRPAERGGGDEALEARIASTLAAGDIFREPLRDTTADSFGRIRGRFCVSASNVAKYDGWHGLVIFDESHPLRFDRAQLHDYLLVALQWIAAAHACDEEAIYPIITWNCLPKSGATLMHGHMQIALARGMHYARVESWRRAAQTYQAMTGAGYFDDLFAVHQALGLAIPRRDMRAFAHLTPLRNREIVLLADLEQGQGEQISLSPRLIVSWSERLADALYTILRSLIDGQGVRAFNLALALPPLRAAGESWEGFPIVARLADRGDPLAPSSDLGAMELFATGCVSADPFDVAKTMNG
jgi:hypothetical protein